MTVESAPLPVPPAAPRPLVLVSWDGKSLPLGLIHLDAAPEFDWVLFDYTGRHAPGPRHGRGQSVWLLSAATECKGEIYHHLAEHLAEQLAGQLSRQPDAAPPEYVALIDDDILISVSQINLALHLGRSEGLDVFAPSLSHDSNRSHRWTLRQPNRVSRPVDWVEVMMPFYRGELFLAGREHYRGNVSSWGVDRYLMPTLQQLAGRTRTALLDAVMASHRRPVTSGQRVFRNGLSAPQEAQLLKQASLQLIDAQAPQLRGSAWFQRVFESRREAPLLRRLKLRLGSRLRAWLDTSA